MTQENKKSELLGVCVIIKRDNTILLGERIGAYAAGAHGLPGGRVEGRESLESCARREIQEETGLTINTLRYLGVVREWQDIHQASFIHFVFTCDDFVGEPQRMEPEKCAGWEWHDINHLPQPMTGGDTAAIEILVQQKSFLRDI